MIADCKTLDDYLRAYGPLLSEQAKASMQPLYDPDKETPLDVSDMKRRPFTAQAHVITGLVRALDVAKANAFVGEMGVGKTIVAMTTIHKHAKGKPYRAIIMCPGQLVEKWSRELQDTIPNCRVTIIDGWKHIHRIDQKRRSANATPLTGPEWYIIGRDRVKLGANWRPAAIVRRHTNGVVCLFCPKCGERQVKKNKEVLTVDNIEKTMTSCNNLACREPLWQYVGKQKGKLDRWEPAHYIHKRMKHYFRYFILDEAHEEKSAESAQGHAAGKLAASCRKTVALTGTLIGGYAEHVRPLLFRLSPRSLVDEGYKWGSPMPFIKAYGRIETVITTREGGDNERSGRQSRRTEGRHKSERMRPGIMPTLFGHHLINNTTYLALNEVAAQLPAYREIVVPVKMDAVVGAEYKRVQQKLVDANKELVRKGNKALLGAMLQCLLCYPDLQDGWGKIGYYEKIDDRKVFIPVVEPRNFNDHTRLRNKESELIKIVKAEKEQGRQCWVFVQYTDTRDVLGRLATLLEQRGLKVGVMRSSVPVAQRERWIREKGRQYDVVLSFPKLVETGLELFNPRPGGCNYCSLIWYETGYNLFTLRQASRRAWRIGQKRDCRVYFLFYEETAQEAAMTLMGKKLHASHALEGKFTADGLVAMGGDEDGSVEMALAKSLSESLPGDAMRAWAQGAIETTVPEDDRGLVEYAGEYEAEDAGTLADLFSDITDDEIKAEKQARKIEAQDDDDFGDLDEVDLFSWIDED